jgi:hypothetical protein
MTLPRSDHAAAFRQHVIPRLRQMVIARSILFWTEDRPFLDLADEIWLEGIRLGSGLLPEDHQEALRDWLYAFLTEQIDAAEKIADDAEKLVIGLLREPSRKVLRGAVDRFVSGQ